MILTDAEHNSPYLAGSFSFNYRVQLKSEDLTIRWAQRHTDIAVREGRGYSTNFYTAEAHPLTFYIPFFTISYTFY